MHVLYKLCFVPQVMIVDEFTLNFKGTICIVCCNCKLNYLAFPPLMIVILIWSLNLIFNKKAFFFLLVCYVCILGVFSSVSDTYFCLHLGCIRTAGILYLFREKNLLASILCSQVCPTSGGAGRGSSHQCLFLVPGSEEGVPMASCCKAPGWVRLDRPLRTGIWPIYWPPSPQLSSDPQ